MIEIDEGESPMFSNLDVFQTAFAMARHAGSRQAVVARNIANADTPGYRAQTISRFQDHVSTGAGTALRTTRAGHQASGIGGYAPPRAETANTEPTPNGNSVSLEEQMVNAVEIEREHNRALTIYRHSLDILRMSIGRR